MELVLAKITFYYIVDCDPAIILKSSKSSPDIGIQTFNLILYGKNKHWKLPDDPNMPPWKICPSQSEDEDVVVAEALT
ncbi:hypothetical protein Tco_1523086 [Tanacetum coccineum]